MWDSHAVKDSGRIQHGGRKVGTDGGEEGISQMASRIGCFMHHSFFMKCSFTACCAASYQHFISTELLRQCLLVHLTSYGHVVLMADDVLQKVRFT